MANTKVTGDLIASGTITAANLVSGTLDGLLNTYLTTNAYATQSYVTTAVNNLIDSAPASLDTLNELAAALNDDANFATTVTNALATKLNLSGGTISGNLTVTGTITGDVTGTLSTVSVTAHSDVTNAGSGAIITTVERDKLAGIESGAEVNTVDSVNGETGVVVLDADDIDDTSTTHKFTTQTDIDKLAGIEAGAEVNDIDGSGTANYVAKWSDSDTLTDSVIYDDGTNVGVGTSSPAAKLDVRTSAVPALSLYRDLNVVAIGSVSQLIDFGGLDGATPTTGASIGGTLENPATTGYLYFNTRTAGVLTEKMRITSGGDVEITSGNIEFANGKGIDFSASAGGGATSSLLDDYEEGTWTPAITFGGNSVGVTYSARLAQYTKIGRQVTASCYVLLANKGTSTGRMIIEGLPYNVGGDVGYAGGVNIVAQRVVYTSGIVAFCRHNTDDIDFYDQISNSSLVEIDNNDLNNNSELIITAIYQTA